MKQHYTDDEIAQLESDLLDAAQKVGLTEEEAHMEYARLMQIGKSSYEAARLADGSYALALAEARARYEIALARLRRAV